MRKLQPWGRRLWLVGHLVGSLGWFGAIAAFVVLVATAATSSDETLVRGALAALHPLALFALVPLAATALITGLVSSLATPWGLLRHYWVVFKLALTVLSLVVFWFYLGTISDVAAAASDQTVEVATLRAYVPSLLLHAGAATAVLLINTVLGVYKPAGRLPGRPATSR